MACAAKMRPKTKNLHFIMYLQFQKSHTMAYLYVLGVQRCGAWPLLSVMYF